ncbi:efflux transporter outer membrane subunit [Massilia niabensis]|uniref:Efflux transporter outer membrane subunit n=1 Tax=Massilia niabensis TaxID=544910 RepID=A0ABW0LB85_9BURK
MKTRLHSTGPFQRMAVAALVAGTLAACSPAQRPEPLLSQVTAPSGWRDGITGEQTIDAQWWHGFGDPALNTLVGAALSRNTDILEATTRVDEARALLQAAHAARQPAINAVLGAQAGHALGATGPTTTRAVQPELQASWEVDLWGRLRQQERVSTLQYQASQVERDGAMLGVAAATVQAYVGLLALDAQLAITRDTVKSREEALRLAKDQARLGYTSQLQLTQAQAEYQAVLGAIPQLELALRRQENGLRLLVGEMPGAVTRTGRLQQFRTPPFAVALPSELLGRRPDIVQAELLLAASNASLASRRAEFLPQVALKASLGSLFVNGLDYDPVSLWSIGGSVLAPIFSAGRITAQVDAATARRDRAAFAYRRTVLAAFGEVENALTAVSRLEEQMVHVRQRRDILARTLGFARDRYESGYAAYLEVLDAQRNLYQTELDEIALRQSQANNMVALYRALGGGWSASGFAAAPPGVIR